MTSGTVIIGLSRPYIVPSAEDAFYVLLKNGRDGWLVGDRRQALATFRELDAIDRRGRA